MHLNRVMDGRKCCIYLPNDRKLELTVHAKQLGKDLIDLVVSEFKIKERDYFGLTYKTSGEHFAWIQDDKKVLDHDTEVKATSRPLEFIFSVKFYEDSVTVHKHPTTVEIIFLHARNLIYKGEINVSSELSFHLAALLLQAVHGDYTSEEEASENFKKLPCLPEKVIREEFSLEYCEEEILTLYKGLQGVTKGQAILLYMTEVEKLPDYGVHYYKVKDKARTPWWLGISNKGIYQYNFDDKVTPHIVFQWRNLENLYFREKKFSVEVCSGHRRALSAGLSSQNQKKNSGNNQQAPKTYAWYGSAALIKSIWIMAIAQHQFYWDRKQSSKSKSNKLNKNNATNLCNALDKNSKSLLTPLQDNSNMQRKHVKNTEVTVKKGSKEQSPEMRALQKKMVVDLKKRKLDLEDRLYDKVQELKEICRQEYDITERLPIEYLRYLLPNEERPPLRKKVGAQFTLTLDKNQSRVNSGSYGTRNSASSEELKQLEADCELLHQITKAAYKLAHDPAARGRTRKKRLISYQKSLKKLQDVENKIDELRKMQGKNPAQRASAFITASDIEIMKAMKECSIDEKSERSSLSDGMMLDDETSISSGAEALSTHSTPALSFRPESESADVDISEGPPPRSKTPPPTRTKVAWLESPKTKTKRDYPLSPRTSYPVLPSPSSYRSSASQSSGTPPPSLTRRNWIERKQDHPRHHNAWKVSSLDSLESIGSMRSTEHGNMSDLGSSPVSNAKNLITEDNANTMRIARAAEAARAANKVSLRDGKRRKSNTSHRMGTVNPVVEIVEGTIVEDGKDSRTSLTDSGNVSASETRLQSGQEDEGLRQTLGPNSMRRDISDSSLSELSTQSNPAILPSSGHHPKFYPPFMTSRNRAHAQNESGGGSKLPNTEQENEGHVRKRSSSFTEVGSNAQKVTLRRDSHRALSRSKSKQGEDNTLRPARFYEDAMVHPYPNGDVPSKDNVDEVKGRPVLSTSQSAQDLPPPMFDTNLNICKQYLSRSQGQLIQNNNNPQQVQSTEQDDENSTLSSPSKTSVHKSVIDEQTWSDVGAFNPANTAYRYNISANNSNNKLNFGQIYKLSQGRATPDVLRINSQPGHQPAHYSMLQDERVQSNAMPKCNSLDSILGSGRVMDSSFNPGTLKNYSFVPQHRPESASSRATPAPYQERSTAPPHGYQEQGMTMHDRDKFNNEAFAEIQGSMGWVPSLDEYGSRASVAESLPAKSKKEDIRELLRQHIAERPKRTPSTSSSATLKLRAKFRADKMKERESENNHYASNETNDGKTWEGYKKMQTMKWNQPTRTEASGNPVNIFRHHPPPPLRQNERQRNHQKYYSQPDTSQPNHQQTIQRQIHKGYVNQNGFVIPMPVNDYGQDMGYHLGAYNGGPTYNTIKPQKSTYPAHSANTSPFERAFHSATLPRHYSSPLLQHGSPTYAQHWASDQGGPTSSSPSESYTHSLPRTHSRGPSNSANFHPIPTSTSPQYHGYTNNNDHYLPRYAPTPLYASPPHDLPNTGAPRKQVETTKATHPSNAGYRYNMKPPPPQRHNVPPMQEHLDQNNSQYQPMQQNDRSLSETWNQQSGLVPTSIAPQRTLMTDRPHHVYHMHQGHHGMMPATAGIPGAEAPRRTASADDLLWSSEPMDQNSYISKQQGTLV